MYALGEEGESYKEGWGRRDGKRAKGGREGCTLCLYIMLPLSF